MRILLTAFEPYGQWKENSSWSTMVELLKDKPQDAELITRRYPVELEGLRNHLSKDLDGSLDAILHLGQSPGIAAIKIETIALNVAGCVEEQGEELPPLTPKGPLAYRTQMPVGRWAETLRKQKIPSLVSYHAGTFLCNATMYLSHNHFREHLFAPQIGFVHLPLATEQVAAMSNATPSLPVATMAQAIRHILQDLVDNHSAAQGNRGIQIV